MEQHLSKMLHQVQLFQFLELKEESQHKLAINMGNNILNNLNHHLYFIDIFSDDICTVFLNVYFWVIFILSMAITTEDLCRL